MTSLPLHVVDLFAGPGGLAEGFASARNSRGERPFRIALSVEKDPIAHRTLLFRAFLRQFGETFPSRYYEYLNNGIEEPDWPNEFPVEWNAAQEEAILLELGSPGSAARLEPLIARVREEAAGRTLVIGGPPCQAYSMVGRARNRGKAGYRPAADERHFLYREYIEILEKLRPVAFVMENVKGILSSSVDGKAIFAQVLADLGAIGGGTQAYELFAFMRGADGTPRLAPTAEPRDFIIRAEDFGIPQARHRVIIIGVRRDAVSSNPLSGTTARDHRTNSKPESAQRATLRHVLTGLPVLRSGLSRGDNAEAWSLRLAQAFEQVAAATISGGPVMDKVHQQLLSFQDRLFARSATPPREAETFDDLASDCPPELRSWLLDNSLKRITGHAARGHMISDLARYLFTSIYALAHGRSPMADDFPAALAPNHRNWNSGHFADRFRAQLWDAPSTTVTSHIAKDGHYFIHPDPLQCRALTVREAARLQTFPDNYRFFGNRTQQFVQVGNAVPPLLAKQIAEAVHSLLSTAGKPAIPRARRAASKLDADVVVFGAGTRPGSTVHDSLPGDNTEGAHRAEGVAR